MRECYHSECDKWDQKVATPERWQFMSMITQSLVLSIVEMSMEGHESKCLKNTVQHLIEKATSPKSETTTMETTLITTTTVATTVTTTVTTRYIFLAQKFKLPLNFSSFFQINYCIYYNNHNTNNYNCSRVADTRGAWPVLLLRWRRTGPS